MTTKFKIQYQWTFDCALLVAMLLAFQSCTEAAAFTTTPTSLSLHKWYGESASHSPSQRRAVSSTGVEHILQDWSTVVSSISTYSTSVWLADTDTSELVNTVDAADETGLLSNQAIVATFVVGLVPFAVATVEFWRRIAVGDTFGTGSDSVVIIGEDDAPLSSRGRRVLGKGALVTAYLLFGVAATVLGIVLYSVLTSGAPETIALPTSAGSA